MKRIVNLLEGKDVGHEIYAVEGYKVGDKAVFVDYGLSTGAETGVHGWLDCFAEAQLGTLDEDLEFVADMYTKEDAPNRQCINKPKDIEGWNPKEDDELVDWEAYARWIDGYCQRVL